MRIFKQETDGYVMIYPEGILAAIHITNTYGKLASPAYRYHHNRVDYMQILSNILMIYVLKEIR